ncbi:site-specific integrase [Amycolatopsis tolypomycina]|uniref:site-specific integrase n=1 Tax=Amycolatopsis tolypomycina TaxID=208445 RepID=UPI0033A361AC
MSAGSVKKRCGCKDRVTGAPLGAKCPKLKSSKHGYWQVRQELAPDGARRRTFRRGGFATKDDGEKVLQKIHEILNISEEPEDRAKVSEMLEKLGRTDPIPDVSEVRRDVLHGLTLNPKTNLGEELLAWLTTKKKLRRSTHNLYSQQIRDYLIPKIGHVPGCRRLTVGHLYEMFASIEDDNQKIVANNEDRRALTAQRNATGDRQLKRAIRAQLDALPPYRRPLSVNSQQKLLIPLRKMLNDMCAQQVLTFNAAAHAKLGARMTKPLLWTVEREEEWRRSGLRPGPVMVWRPDHVGYFLDFVSVEDPDFESMWHLFCKLGPRRGEAAALSWANCQLAKRVIDILSQLTEVNYEVSEETPKSDAGSRHLPLDQATADLLSRDRERQMARMAEYGSAWVDSGRIYTQPDGSPLQPSSIGYRFEKLCEASGLPPIRLHDLRHTAATTMFAAGVDPKIIQYILGHASLKVTMDIYTDVLPELIVASVDAAVALVPTNVLTPGAHLGHTEGR